MDANDAAAASALTVRPPSSARHDIVALGECMVRLSPPGHGRIEFAKSFEVDVGGGEYNVAYACSRLGLRAAFASKLPLNPLAEIILNHARSAGMDVSHVAREQHDGVGRSNRVGLYFAEIGMGVRGGMALFDRGNSSAAQMRPTDIDWRRLFGTEGARWLHSGGIFAVLSDSTRETLRTAIQEAKAAKTVVSYDLNFRPALADSAKAAAINRTFIADSDVLIGSPDGFCALLGDKAPEKMDALVGAVAQAFPNLRLIAGTERTVHHGNRHDLAGFAWMGGKLSLAEPYRDLEIVDRVGTGDAFAAGIVQGMLNGRSLEQTLDFALAYAALVHTTRGDTSQFTAPEIQAVADGASAVMRR
jgi:2-dehydro-3-deoxygluconokinase